MTNDEKYILRCIELARNGAGWVAPNPMVGAVLVHEGKIIGEGYHEKYGQAHAEVNCINSVADHQRKLIESSCLYVCLEPCAHHGKTPPCTDLILKTKIPKVVVGCADPYREVNGRGIQKLQEAGVEVVAPVLESACIALNRRFFTFHQLRRPYIILKWAQTSNAKIANRDFSRLYISNAFTNRLMHRWRSEESSIAVGKRTALSDNPALTVRWWKGKNPIRLIVDMDLSLPQSLKVFDGESETIIFNSQKSERHHNVLYYQLSRNLSVVHQITQALYNLGVQSLMVEGGATLIQSFVDQKFWDEARVITNHELIVPNGIAAPELEFFSKTHTETLGNDSIDYYRQNTQ